MHQITREEFRDTRDYFEKKAMELMRHEDKNHAVTGVPLENYRAFEIEGRKFYSVQTNTFKTIVDRFLLAAQDSNPEKFGTGEALDVVEALRLMNPIVDWDASRFAEFLSSEQFTHVFESQDGKVVDRILRIDLFRLLKPKKGKNEFVGGILHALKHFSRGNTNYSTGKSAHELQHPQVLIKEIIDAFFCANGTFETPDQYVVLKPYDENHNLKFVFYKEQSTGVFFLKTVYKESK